MLEKYVQFREGQLHVKCSLVRSTVLREILPAFISKVRTSLRENYPKKAIDPAFWDAPRTQVMIYSILVVLWRSLENGRVKETDWLSWPKSAIISPPPIDAQALCALHEAPKSCADWSTSDLEQLCKTLEDLKQYTFHPKRTPDILPQTSRSSPKGRPDRSDHHTVITVNGLNLDSDQPWLKKASRKAILLRGEILEDSERCHQLGHEDSSGGQSSYKESTEAVNDRAALGHGNSTNSSTVQHKRSWSSASEERSGPQSDYRPRKRKRITGYKSPRAPPVGAKCPYCGSYCHGTAGSTSRHIKRCIGRCLHCREHGLDCDFLTGERATCSHCGDAGCVFLPEYALNESIRENMLKRLCVKCGKVHNRTPQDMKRHKEVCLGRCEACSQDRKPCLKRIGQVHCIRCEETDIECSFVSSNECHKCGFKLSTSSVQLSRRHQIRCVGRCVECQSDNSLCEWTDHSQRCAKCSSLGRHCVFMLEVDDSEMRTAIAERLCNGCGGMFRNPSTKDTHAQTCLGKCQQCARLDIPCFRPGGYHYAHKKCYPCEKAGRSCT